MYPLSGQRKGREGRPVMGGVMQPAPAVIVSVLVSFNAVMRTRHRNLHIRGKGPITELHPQSLMCVYSAHCSEGAW